MPLRESKWPLITSMRQTDADPVQVVYDVPGVGVVTEIIDYADPLHRQMIERAKSELGCEVKSITKYRLDAGEGF